MDPFDDGYLARREKQIQNLYILRAMSVAFGGLGLAGMALVFFLHEMTWAPMAFFFSALFLIAAFLLFIISTAQSAADRAIQKEHERLIALYSQAGLKRKRDEPAEALRLADDGEIDADALPDERPRASRRQGPEGRQGR